MCPARPLGGCGQRSECPSHPPRGSAQDKYRAGDRTAAFRAHTGNVIRNRDWPSFPAGALRNQSRAEGEHLSGAATLLRPLGRSPADSRPWMRQVTLEQVRCTVTEIAVPSLNVRKKHLGWVVKVKLPPRFQEHLDSAHLGHLQF